MSKAAEGQWPSLPGSVEGQWTSLPWSLLPGGSLPGAGGSEFYIQDPGPI